jgi:hypothetical protein
MTKPNTENPGRIVKLYAPLLEELHSGNQTSEPLEFRDSAQLMPKKRVVTFPVYSNSQCFRYPSEVLKQEIGNLNGRPGVDDDNDTTESLIKKQVKHIFKNIVRGVDRENKYFNPQEYLNSLPSVLSSQSGSSMKVDDSRLLKLGSSIAEETVANTSISDISIGDNFTTMFPLSSSSFSHMRHTVMDAETPTHHQMSRQELTVKQQDFGKSSRDQTVNMDIVMPQSGKRSKSSNVNKLYDLRKEPMSEKKAQKSSQMRTRIDSECVTSKGQNFSEYAVVSNADFF